MCSSRRSHGGPCAPAGSSRRRLFVPGPARSRKRRSSSWRPQEKTPRSCAGPRGSVAIGDRGGCGTLSLNVRRWPRDSAVQLRVAGRPASAGSASHRQRPHDPAGRSVSGARGDRWSVRPPRARCPSQSQSAYDPKPGGTLERRLLFGLDARSKPLQLCCGRYGCLRNPRLILSGEPVRQIDVHFKHHQKAHKYMQLHVP